MLKKVVILALMAFMVTGCAMNEGSKGRSIVEAITSQSGKPLPEPSPGFSPKEVLPFTSQEVHKATIYVLDESGVSILIDDDNDGRISTDYVAGPRFSTAFGMLGSNSTRYKYIISIKPRDKDSSKLLVNVFLESSGNEIQSWRDVSEENQAAVRNIRHALLENIETHLGNK